MAPGRRSREQPFWRGAAALLERDGVFLGLGFFLKKKIAPSPLCVSCGPIFLGKMLFELQNWSFNFYIFVNFDFSCIF